MMQMNTEWFAGPVGYSIHSGIKTNTKRALSGEVWASKTLGRDTLTMEFMDRLNKEGADIVNWLYQNSAKGWENDADAFNLYFERKEPKHSILSEGYENGFRGVVRLNSDDFLRKIGRNFSNFSIELEIISYEEF